MLEPQTVDDLKGEIVYVNDVWETGLELKLVGRRGRYRLAIDAEGRSDLGADGDWHSSPSLTLERLDDND